MAIPKQSELNSGPARIVVPSIAIPMLAGAVSLLAVVNASPRKEGLVDVAVVYGGWYIVACVVMILLRKRSVEDLIKWSPAVGGVGIAALLIPVMIGGPNHYGIPGAVGILPSKGVFVIPWHLVIPVYIAWLIRFSPARTAPGSISWKAFGIFCVAGAVWWIPLILTSSVSGIIAFLVIFILLSWLDAIPADKLIAAILIGSAAIAGTYYRLSGYINLKSDSGLLRTAFGTGGLFGRQSGDAFQITYFLPKTDSYTVFLSAVESIGVVGVIAILACAAAAIVWGFRQLENWPVNQRLLVELFIAYFLISTVTFLWSVTGILPRADFSAPLLNGSGCDLVATIFMLSLILREPFGPRAGGRSKP